MYGIAGGAAGSGLGRAADARFGRMPRAFWWLWTGHVVNRFGTIVEPFLALYLAARGVRPATIGALLALYGLGSLAAQPVGGWMADRFGARRSLVASLWAAAGSLALLGAVRNPALLWLGCPVAGACIDLSRPVVLAAAAQLTGARDRSRGQALLFWGSGLGFALGSLAAGVLASAGYGWLFLVDAATCGLFAAIVQRWVPEIPRPPAPARGAWRAVAGDGPAVAFVVLQLLAAIAIFQLPTVGGLTLHLTAREYGVMLAAGAVLVALGQPVATSWLLRRDPSRALVAGTALTALGCALAAAGTAPAAVVALSGGQIVMFAVAPGVMASLGDRLPGRYQGLSGASYSLAFLLAPLLGGALLATASASAAWLFAGGLCLLAAAGHCVLAPALRARLA